MQRTSCLIAGLALTACATTDLSEADLQPYEPLPAYQTIGAPASEEDRRAISTLLTMTGQAWAEGDAKMFAKGYADDAEWMNAFGQIRRSASSIEAYLTELFAEAPDGLGEDEAANFVPISMRYVGDNVAIVHFATTSVRAGVLPGADERRVHTTVVMEKRDDGWTIVHEHISDARPAVAEQ
ncbi:MAG: SgcJ/EcaC family oxidoreductase [Pseudomonadota bacterium]